MDDPQGAAIAELPGISLPEDGGGQALAPEYQLVRQYIEQHRHKEAGDLLHDLLTRNPDDGRALYLLCRLLIDTDRPAIAHSVAEKLCDKDKSSAERWFILGAVEACLQRPEVAIPALERALSIKPELVEAWRVLSTCFVMAYDWESAERVASKALELGGEHHMPRTALAFVHLHRREWQPGWQAYQSQMGRVKDRCLWNYGLPDWKGENGNLLVYAEQGLGDQLVYTSCLDGRLKQLVTHPKLENLLDRSLTGIEVYGDQFTKDTDWAPKADYQTSMSGAMQWLPVRPRGRWLIPHPDKVTQWRALMMKKSRGNNRPWVGLGWTGGKVGSHGWQTRNLTLQQLSAVLALPFNFVSLEYRVEIEPCERYGIHRWPWATQTNDLDDVAALIECLDAVVCVPTTSYHLAGGLGKPAFVIVHDKPHFHEGTSGGCPWWESVEFYRRPDLGTDGAVEAVADRLKAYL